MYLVPHLSWLCAFFLCSLWFALLLTLSVSWKQCTIDIVLQGLSYCVTNDKTADTLSGLFFSIVLWPLLRSAWRRSLAQFLPHLKICACLSRLFVTLCFGWLWNSTHLTVCSHVFHSEESFDTFLSILKQRRNFFLSYWWTWNLFWWSFLSMLC